MSKSSGIRSVCNDLVFAVFAIEIYRCLVRVSLFICIPLSAVGGDWEALCFQVICLYIVRPLTPNLHDAISLVSGRFQ